MKKTFLASVLALGLLAPSCLGPDNLYHTVKNWNAQVSDEDWVNEVVFLAFIIIPVYGVAMFGDIVIFNTIDYWTGDNPINDPGPFPGFAKDA